MNGVSESRESRLILPRPGTGATTYHWVFMDLSCGCCMVRSIVVAFVVCNNLVSLDAALIAMMVLCLESSYGPSSLFATI